MTNIYQDSRPQNKKQIQSQMLPQQLPTNKQTQNNYKQYPYRFFNLFMFLVVTITSTLPYQTYTAINSQMVQIFGYSKLIISLNGLMYPIVHPLFAFVAGWILDKFGLKIGFICAGMTIIFGSWLRMLIDISIYPSIVGSFFVAFGTIFIINSPTKFANNWFRPQIVPTMISIIVIIGYFSSSISLVYPTLFINDNSTKQDIKFMMLIQCIIVTATIVPFMILFKSKPKSPPSFSAGAIKQMVNFRAEMKILFKNKNYDLLMIVAGISYGTFVAVLNVIQYLLKPFFQTGASKIASQSLLLACFFGILSCFLFTYILKRTKKYKAILLFLMSGSVITICSLALILNLQSVWLIYLSITIIGFFMIPIIPIILQFSCELVFPVGEASSTGFLYASGQFLGFGLGLLFLSFLDGKNKWRTQLVTLIFGGLNLLGVLVLLLIKQDLRRTNYELKKLHQSQLNKKQQEHLLANTYKSISDK